MADRVFRITDEQRHTLVVALKVLAHVQDTVGQVFADQGLQAPKQAVEALGAGFEWPPMPTEGVYDLTHGIGG